MSRLLTIWNHIRRHKYLITIVAFLVMIVFLDENSLIQRAQHKREISTLKSEIARYRKQYEEDTWYDVIVDLSTVNWTGGESVGGTTASERWESIAENTKVDQLLLRPFGFSTQIANSTFDIKYVAFFETEEDASSYKFKWGRKI